MERSTLGALLFLVLGTPANSQDADRPVHVLYPLTVRGNAVDTEAKPIPGAKVFLLSTNRTRPGGFNPLLAETTTDRDGRYAFDGVRVPALPPDGGPLHKHLEGSIQVYAIASGYGFTWHPQQRFRPDAMRTADADKDVIHTGEQGVANLTFDHAATIHGRVTNDRGEPLKGVEIQLGHVNDLRRTGSSGSWRCNYLGPPGEDERAIEDGFAGIMFVPKEMRSATTDENGRYSIRGLRRETSYLGLIDYQPEYEPLVLDVATTDSKKAKFHRQLGYDGELNHVFAAPREIRVHVTAPDGGDSLANVTIRARRDRLQRAGNLAITDADGRATLRLPPDKYTLFAEPPLDAPFLVTELPLAIASEDQSREIKLALTSGATLLVEASLAGMGEPLPGIEFLRENAEGTERQELHSQSMFLDYPMTDKEGRLRAIVAPGRGRLVVGKHPAHFEPVRSTSELFDVAGGQVHTVKFEFKKQKEPGTPPQLAKLSEELEKLRGLTERQQALSPTGNYRIRLFQGRLEGISPDELHSLLQACDYMQIPDIVGLIQRRFPQKSLGLVKGTICVDGIKRRSETVNETGESRIPNHVMVDNGREVIMLMPDSAQASIFDRGRMYVHGPERMLHRPFFPGAAGDGTMPDLRITRDAGKLTLVVEDQKNRYVQVIEEKSGFLIHSSYRRGSNSGTEVWQFAPRTTETGLLLAGMGLEFRMANDRINSVFIDELDEVVLERPSPEAFVVAVPPGTNIVDSRGNQPRPKTALVTYPIRDVVLRANQIDESDRSILPVLKIGQPAPPISAAEWLSASGKAAAPELTGKVVLIDFWGIGCGPCVAELPDVQALAKEFAGKDFVLVGLHESGHDAAEVAEFAHKRGLTYPLAVDLEAMDAPAFGATFKAYGVRGIPNCAVIDRDGKVAFIGRFSDAARAAAKLLGDKGE